MTEPRNFFYRRYLHEEFSRRSERNPRYSLRSFAAALSIDASDLSQILSGKRKISTRIADRILTALEIAPDEKRDFIESIIQEKTKSGLQRISPLLKERLHELSDTATPTQSRGIGLDQFRIIADWYHYAILALAQKKGFTPDPRKIASRLNITRLEARLAVERLIDLGLLEKKDQQWIAVSKAHTLDKSKTSAFHRRRQKQILEKSIHSLEHDPIEMRNHRSMTFCLDPKKIPEAKKRVDQFLWELSQFLMEGSPSLVYELHLGLIPLEKIEGTSI